MTGILFQYSLIISPWLWASIRVTCFTLVASSYVLLFLVMCVFHSSLFHPLSILHPFGLSFLPFLFLFFLPPSLFLSHWHTGIHFSKSPKLLYRTSAVFAHTEDYGELVHCVYIVQCYFLLVQVYKIHIVARRCTSINFALVILPQATSPNAGKLVS